MAKFGIALGSGPRGHGFKSRHSDHFSKMLETARVSGIFFALVSRLVFLLNFKEPRGKEIMRKKPTIRMKSKETAAELFELFLLTKRADGVKPRTIETYK